MVGPGHGRADFRPHLSVSVETYIFSGGTESSHAGVAFCAIGGGECGPGPVVRRPLTPSAATRHTVSERITCSVQRNDPWGKVVDVDKEPTVKAIEVLCHIVGTRSTM